MDASISDILASVTRAHHSASREDASHLQRADFQLLTQAWISERVAPELLPYPGELMKRVMMRLQSQIESIEDRTSRTDAGTSFVLVMLQTELERTKYLIRSYLRTRIVKIDAHLQHNINLHANMQSLSSLDLSDGLMSASEIAYAKRHAAMLEDHYTTSFLSSFPPKLRQMDDKAGAGGVAMIEGPDLDQAVFVRCLGRPRKQREQTLNGHDRSLMFEGDVSEENDGDVHGDIMEHDNAGEGFDPIEISCGFSKSPALAGPDQARGTGPARTEGVTQMRRGDVWIVRWSSVREAVARGECQLI